MSDAARRCLAAPLACAAAAAAMVASLSPAQAQTVIGPGQNLAVSLPGTTSIYQIFGRSGSGNPPADDAPFLVFSPGAGQVFTFPTVTGGVNCCSDPADLNTPDGKTFQPFVGWQPNTVVAGINGLSDAMGNNQLPLVGVFTTDTDPFGQAAPAALPWDAAAPVALAPLLHQVFYIGDGRSGFNDAGGSLLGFTAPAAATRLYLGFADAGNFSGSAGWYLDNPGSMNATAMLSAVPEPATWGLALAGLAWLGGLARRR